MKNFPSISGIRHGVVAFALFLLTGAVYSSVLGAGFVVIDDDLYVTENHAVEAGLTAEGIRWSFETVEGGNWHPLTWLSLMADVSALGNSPAAHHAVNAALHAAGVILLYFALHAMTGAAWRSAFVAALFAVHPLHVESVAWISERKDVLSGVFWMLAMWGYAYYTNRPSWRRYLAVAVPFTLGLLAKPMVVTFPFAMILFDYWPLRRWTSGWRELLRLFMEKIPLIVLSVAIGLVAIFTQNKGGAMGPMVDVGFPARFANAFVSYARYLGKTIWPINLSVFYPHPGNGISIPLAAGAVLVLVLLSTGAIVTFRNRPWLATGWFWFLGTLVPVIGIVQVGMQGMSDRYMYIPLVGLGIAVTWEVAELFPKNVRGTTALAVLSVAILAALGLTARAQAAYWKNSGTLLAHALRVDPNNWYAEHCLGYAFAKEGSHAAAIGHFRKALALSPNCLTLNCLGAVLGETGDTEGAAACFSEAIRINPDYPDAVANLGRARLQQGRTAESIDLFRRALKLQPDYAPAHDGLEAALAVAARKEH